MIYIFIFILFAVSHLSAGVILEEDGDHLVVALLQRDGQRGEAVLGGEALVGAGCEELPHDAVVVLLRGHVERREAILRLHVHARLVLDQDPHNLLL